MKNNKEKVIPSEIEKKVVANDKSKVSSLEKIAKTNHNDKEVDEVKEVIEGLVSELEPNKIYEKIEKKLKENELDEKEAMELGFKPDNYYTAKGKKMKKMSLNETVKATAVHLEE